MDAARLLGLLRPLLDSVHARWMLAGGFAVAAWGSARSTFDLDLLVEESDRSAVRDALTATGFSTLYDCAGFTNLSHADPGLGRLDLIWIEGQTSLRMFASAVQKVGPDGRTALVPSPEHLIAMKVKAIRNRPTRVFRDGEDIRILLSVPGIDENAVREVFDRNGLTELYARLKAST